MKNKNDELIAALDIGSSKITITISEIDESGNISVLGIGKADSKGGIRQGVVINLEAIANTINQAVEEAEIQAGREITGVFVGISGSNIDTINSKGVVAISGSDKEIKNNDIARVIEAARAVAIPMDKEMLHIIPQGFLVDGQTNVKYPVGMVGTRLECQIHILTIPSSSIQNIVKCLDRCGIEIYDVVLQNLAAAKAVLDNDEKEIGVLMIDLGAETAKVSIYYQGAPYYNYIYPLGGHLINNDLAIGLKIPINSAEKIKLAFGVADFDYVDREEKIQIPSVGGRKPRILARENLVHIIKPRIEEIFNIIKQDITKKGYIDKISGGIVLTGGTSQLPGICEVCQDVFDIQARIGIPKKFYGLGDQLEYPENSVIAGLLQWGFDKISRQDNTFSKNNRETNKEKNFFGTIKKIFDELF